MALGGAERIVADLAGLLGGSLVTVLLRDAAPEHTLPDGEVHRLGQWPRAERFSRAAALIRQTGLPAYCHLIALPDLEALWKAGCRTVPVVHNSRPGWKADATAFDHPAVPFVAACGEAVARELVEAGLRKPVRVLRHIPCPAPAMTPQQRDRARAAFGAGPATVLIGMVGRFAAQKDYPRAVRILAVLTRRGVDARLAIIGPATGPAALLCRQQVHDAAVSLGVRDRLVMPGPVGHAARLLPAFDVFLNTSLFEGVSVATAEAAQAGVPCVVSAVGGQAEAAGEGAAFMDADAPDEAWADVVCEGRLRLASPPDRRARPAGAQAWPWSLVLGPGATLARPLAGVVFVTGNMDIGGAQRSLCNLAAGLARRGVRVTVGIAGPVGAPGLMHDAQVAGVEFLDLAGAATLAGRAAHVMTLAQQRAPVTLVFWNLDAATKLVVAKVMAGGPVRLADVSPGPMLFTELASELDFATTLAAEAYLASLDVFVSKYADGLPLAQLGKACRAEVIPNGVPEPAGLPDGDGPAPPDPALAVVTVGRLALSKRPGLLPQVARALHGLLPGATLTVVGGLHPGRSQAAWNQVLAHGPLPDNLRFAGPDHRPLGFLHRFAVFMMVSDHQGCPNASLEAMACGLPVVANPDGGTAEQIVHGMTGLLVPDGPDQASRIAAALASLLRDPARARAMGQAGRARARARFSMAAMTDRYYNLLVNA